MLQPEVHCLGYLIAKGMPLLARLVTLFWFLISGIALRTTDPLPRIRLYQGFERGMVAETAYNGYPPCQQENIFIAASPSVREMGVQHCWQPISFSPKRNLYAFGCSSNLQTVKHWEKWVISNKTNNGLFPLITASNKAETNRTWDPLCQRFNFQVCPQSRSPWDVIQGSHCLHLLTCVIVNVTPFTFKRVSVIHYI